MSWLSRVFGKRSTEHHRFSDDEREKAQIARLEKAIRQQRIDALKARLAYIKQMQEEEELERSVAQAEEMLNGDEEEDERFNPVDAANDPDAMLMSILGKVLAGKPNVQPTPQPAGSTKQHVSDEDIQKYVAGIPGPVRDALRKQSDGDVARQVMEYAPTIDDESVARAVRAIKA